MQSIYNIICNSSVGSPHMWFPEFAITWNVCLTRPKRETCQLCTSQQNQISNKKVNIILCRLFNYKIISCTIKGTAYILIKFSSVSRFFGYTVKL